MDFIKKQRHPSWEIAEDRLRGVSSTVRRSTRTQAYYSSCLHQHVITTLPNARNIFNKNTVSSSRNCGKYIPYLSSCQEIYVFEVCKPVAKICTSQSMAFMSTPEIPIWWIPAAPAAETTSSLPSSRDSRSSETPPSSPPPPGSDTNQGCYPHSLGMCYDIFSIPDAYIFVAILREYLTKRAPVITQSFGY